MTERAKVLVEHDQATDTTYYRENPARPCADLVVGVNLGAVDWLDVAKQKQALLGQIWEDRASPLWGLVAFLDHVQDAADRAGLPVVWATEDGDEVSVPAGVPGHG